MQLNLVNLYDIFSGNLKHAKIFREVDGQGKYHYLNTEEAGEVCVDGEEVEVV